ncbi:hypothetical protein [Spirulina sp. 06S082]|nr:hypothetical protein [Spirulina sp. 06S082]MEA5468948.1 hypothetical protein [Spirulina sp. 06S082]
MFINWVVSNRYFYFLKKAIASATTDSPVNYIYTVVWLKNYAG